MLTVKLEDWALVEDEREELGEIIKEVVICGFCFNHPSFSDGTLIKTSKIVDARENMALSTNSVLYELGRPNDSFKEWFRSVFGKEIDISKPFEDG